jgi:hypothetical protein
MIHRRVKKNSFSAMESTCSANRSVSEVPPAILQAE